MLKTFYDLGWALYSGFLKEKPVITVADQHAEIARKVVKKVGWRTEVHGAFSAVPAVHAEPNRKVMLGFSSGLDSVYLLHKLIDDGYDVTAVHIQGLNKSSASVEAQQAKKIAGLANANFVNVKFNAPTQAFADNPFKNQLVLSIMLDIGSKREIYRYALGSDWTTPLAEAVAGYTITDSIEVNEEFWKGVQVHFPQAELLFIDKTTKKYERLQYLFTKHLDSLQCVSSCIAPVRFRQHWHEQNLQKYGVRLMAGRCGSCYKCSMEYILLVEAGLLPKNEKYLEHCWHILATSKTAHRPDLFSEKLPLAVRLKNLKNYGS